MAAIATRDESALLERCQEVVGYRFNDLTFLREALTHASGADHRLVSNERLEFLGDAILGAIVCETLFRRFPGFLEGELTRVKSVVVSRTTCAKISRFLGLEEFLVLGKGMGSPDGAPASVLAGFFESLLAAIFLDGGMDAARGFVLPLVEPEIDSTVDGHGGVNHKSNLQQLSQRKFGETPIYALLDEKGPDHSKCFKIEAQIGRRRFAAAWGKNKKDAEQRAAMNALAQISGTEPPNLSD